MHIYLILLFAYRDNGRISFASSTAEEFFVNYNYDCVGNEAIIRECPYNYKSCPSSPTSGRSKRTDLNCTGKIDFVLDTYQFIFFKFYKTLKMHKKMSLTVIIANLTEK